MIQPSCLSADMTLQTTSGNIYTSYITAHGTDQTADVSGDVFINKFATIGTLLNALDSQKKTGLYLPVLPYKRKVNLTPGLWRRHMEIFT